MVSMQGPNRIAKVAGAAGAELSPRAGASSADPVAIFEAALAEANRQQSPEPSLTYPAILQDLKTVEREVAALCRRQWLPLLVAGNSSAAELAALQDQAAVIAGNNREIGESFTVIFESELEKLRGAAEWARELSANLPQLRQEQGEHSAALLLDRLAAATPAELEALRLALAADPTKAQLLKELASVLAPPQAELLTELLNNGRPAFERKALELFLSATPQEAGSYLELLGRQTEGATLEAFFAVKEAQDLDDLERELNLEQHLRQAQVAGRITAADLLLYQARRAPAAAANQLRSELDSGGTEMLLAALNGRFGDYQAVDQAFFEQSGQSALEYAANLEGRGRLSRLEFERCVAVYQGDLTRVAAINLLTALSADQVEIAVLNQYALLDPAEQQLISAALAEWQPGLTVTELINDAVLEGRLAAPTAELLQATAERDTALIHALTLRELIRGADPTDRSSRDYRAFVEALSWTEILQMRERYQERFGESTAELFQRSGGDAEFRQALITVSSREREELLLRRALLLDQERPGAFSVAEFQAQLEQIEPSQRQRALDTLRRRSGGDPGARLLAAEPFLAETSPAFRQKVQAVDRILQGEWLSVAELQQLLVAETVELARSLGREQAKAEPDYRLVNQLQQRWEDLQASNRVLREGRPELAAALTELFQEQQTAGRSAAVLDLARDYCYRIGLEAARGGEADAYRTLLDGLSEQHVEFFASAPELKEQIAAQRLRWELQGQADWERAWQLSGELRRSLGRLWDNHSEIVGLMRDNRELSALIDNAFEQRFGAQFGGGFYAIYEKRRGAGPYGQQLQDIYLNNQVGDAAGRLYSALSVGSGRLEQLLELYQRGEQEDLRSFNQRILAMERDFISRYGERRQANSVATLLRQELGRNEWALLERARSGADADTLALQQLDQMLQGFLVSNRNILNFYDQLSPAVQEKALRRLERHQGDSSWGNSAAVQRIRAMRSDVLEQRLAADLKYALDGSGRRPNLGLLRQVLEREPESFSRERLEQEFKQLSGGLDPVQYIERRLAVKNYSPYSSGQLPPPLVEQRLVQALWERGRLSAAENFAFLLQEQRWEEAEAILAQACAGSSAAAIDQQRDVFAAEFRQAVGRNLEAFIIEKSSGASRRDLLEALQGAPQNIEQAFARFDRQYQREMAWWLGNKTVDIFSSRHEELQEAYREAQVLYRSYLNCKPDTKQQQRAELELATKIELGWTALGHYRNTKETVSEYSAAAVRTAGVATVVVLTGGTATPVMVGLYVGGASMVGATGTRMLIGGNTYETSRLGADALYSLVDGVAMGGTIGASRLVSRCFLKDGALVNNSGRVLLSREALQRLSVRMAVNGAENAAAGFAAGSFLGGTETLMSGAGWGEVGSQALSRGAIEGGLGLFFGAAMVPGVDLGRTLGRKASGQLTNVYRTVQRNNANVSLTDQAFRHSGFNLEELRPRRITPAEPPRTPRVEADPNAGVLSARIKAQEKLVKAHEDWLKQGLILESGTVVPRPSIEQGLIQARRELSGLLAAQQQAAERLATQRASQHWRGVNQQREAVVAREVRLELAAKEQRAAQALARQQAEAAQRTAAARERWSKLEAELAKPVPPDRIELNRRDRVHLETARSGTPETPRTPARGAKSPSDSPSELRVSFEPGKAPQSVKIDLSELKPPPAAARPGDIAGGDGLTPQRAAVPRETFRPVALKERAANPALERLLDRVLPEPKLPSVAAAPKASVPATQPATLQVAPLKAPTLEYPQPQLTGSALSSRLSLSAASPVGRGGAGIDAATATVSREASPSLRPVKPSLAEPRLRFPPEDGLAQVGGPVAGPQPSLPTGVGVGKLLPSARAPRPVSPVLAGSPALQAVTPRPVTPKGSPAASVAPKSVLAPKAQAVDTVLVAEPVAAPRAALAELPKPMPRRGRVELGEGADALRVELAEGRPRRAPLAEPQPVSNTRSPSLEGRPVRPVAAPKELESQPLAQVALKERVSPELEGLNRLVNRVLPDSAPTPPRAADTPTQRPAALTVASPKAPTLEYPQPKLTEVSVNPVRRGSSQTASSAAAPQPVNPALTGSPALQTVAGQPVMAKAAAPSKSHIGTTPKAQAVDTVLVAEPVAAPRVALAELPKPVLGRGRLVVEGTEGLKVQLAEGMPRRAALAEPQPVSNPRAPSLEGTPIRPAAAPKVKAVDAVAEMDLQPQRQPLADPQPARPLAFKDPVANRHLAELLERVLPDPQPRAAVHPTARVTTHPTGRSTVGTTVDPVAARPQPILSDRAGLVVKKENELAVLLAQLSPEPLPATGLRQVAILPPPAVSPRSPAVVKSVAGSPKASAFVAPALSQPQAAPRPVPARALLDPVPQPQRAYVPSVQPMAVPSPERLSIPEPQRFASVAPAPEPAANLGFAELSAPRPHYATYPLAEPLSELATSRKTKTETKTKQKNRTPWEEDPARLQARRREDEKREQNEEVVRGEELARQEEQERYRSWGRKRRVEVGVEGDGGLGKATIDRTIGEA